jgi:hypothetical protein
MPDVVKNHGRLLDPVRIDLALGSIMDGGAQ